MPRFTTALISFAMTLASSHLLPGADIADDRVAIQMALFYAPTPSSDPLPALRELSSTPDLACRVIDPGSDATDPLPVVWAHWAPIDRYGPPTEQAWRYRTRGLPAELQPQLAAAPRALVLDFLVARADAVAANERIARLVSALAEATGGLPWDEEARCLQSLAEWKHRRVESWSAALPDMRRHIVIDSYRDGELLRMVTIGMRKFGLPDLVTTGVTAHAFRSIEAAMTASAQLLVEGRANAAPFTIELRAVRHEGVRTWLLEHPHPGAVGTVVATLTPVATEEGDADNALLALDFPGDGASQQERQQTAIAALFGTRDELIVPKSDPKALEAASALARARLLALRDRFADGFDPGEHLAIKGPFLAEDGRKEWMWVEVTTWKGDTFTGTLTNQPFWAKHLRPGSRVQVEAADVYDYIWTKPDGSREGNETGRMMQAAESKP